MKKIIKKIQQLIEIIIIPLVLVSALSLKIEKKFGVQNLSLSKNHLLKIRVFPIRNYYYDPQFLFNPLKDGFRESRILSGIDWNFDEQLNLLHNFKYATELYNLPIEKTDILEFYAIKHSFVTVDVEYWYRLIRYFKPKRISEISSGHSTKFVDKSTKINKVDDKCYDCQHISIVSYEMFWIKKINVKDIINIVELIKITLSKNNQENQILSIDSTHIIRPKVAVLYEFLSIFPLLNKGDILLVHDRLSPNNYPVNCWLVDDARLWNEQYILEAFLTNSDNCGVISALSILNNCQYDKLKKIAPYHTKERVSLIFYHKS